MKSSLATITAATGAENGPGSALFTSTASNTAVPGGAALTCLAFKCNYWGNIIYFPLWTPTIQISCKQTADATVLTSSISGANAYASPYSGAITCPNSVDSLTTAV